MQNWIRAFGAALLLLLCAGCAVAPAAMTESARIRLGVSGPLHRANAGAGHLVFCPDAGGLPVFI